MGMSVRTYDRHKDSVIEALRRTKFKFPGRQKIYISKKWGFTKWDREVYEEMRAEGKLQPDGVNVQYKPEHGPLSEWCKIQAELRPLRASLKNGPDRKRHLQIYPPLP